MKVICGWCGRYISGPKDAKTISHGICPSCVKSKFPELEEEE